MNLLLSVIIPAYNVEDYIESCLRSVSRELGNDTSVEVIIVNDGSTDRTWEKILAFRRARPDLQLKLIDQRNGGLSLARNVGLDAAAGRFVAFLDSDDFWTAGFWQTLKPRLLHAQADIVEYDVLLVDEAGKPIEPLPICLAADGRRAVDEALLMRYAERFRNFAWARVYRAALFADVRFPVGRRYEDVVITAYLYSIAASVDAINRPLVAYRLREGDSITSTAPAMTDVHHLLASAAEASRHAGSGASRRFWVKIALKIHVMICMHILRLPLRQRLSAAALIGGSFPATRPGEIGAADRVRGSFPRAYIGFLSARQATRGVLRFLQRPARAG